MRVLLPVVLLLLGPLAGCVQPQVEATAPSETGSSTFCLSDPCAQEVIPGWHAEPWVAFDPTDPQRALVATFGTTGHWGSWVYVATTLDGGRTWTHGPAPPLADDPLEALDGSEAFPVRQPGLFVDHRPIAADTMTAWTKEGHALVLALTGRNTYASASQGPVKASGAARPSEIVLWRSEDSGQTWSEGQVLVAADGAVAFTSAGRLDVNRWHDKPFLLVDPANGDVHVFWNVVMGRAPGTEILAITSQDGGRTWSEPRTVASGLYGVSAAAYDGTLLLTARNPGYQLLRSTDAGATWTRLGQVGEWPGPTSTWQGAPVGLWREGDTLRALLVRAEGPQGERVVLQRSDDLGDTWSEPVSLLPERASHKRNPVLALDPATGHGFVAAYQGVEGDPDALETWVAPLRTGAPGAPFSVSSRTASGPSVFEYFGGAATATGGILSYASPAQDGAPAHAVTLRWD